MLPELSAYEHIVYLYSSLHEKYKWTKQYIDQEDLEYILDLFVVVAKVQGNREAEKICYIDEVI